MDIYLTLDYELFMGIKTGGVEDCLVMPMNELQKIVEKHNVKLTIFVDAAYLLRLYELKNDNPYAELDYTNVTKHIRLLEKCGHDIELHFHPQWLFSYMKGPDWIMDIEHYSLADTPQVEEWLFRAKTLIDGLLEKPTMAFRAGGYTIQNYSCYPSFFQKAGIKCDSSVLRDHKCNSKYQIYDYTSVPSKQIYKFNTDICKEDVNGSFVEVSISNTKMNRMLYLGYRFFTKYALRDNQKYGKGVPVSSDFKNKLKTMDSIKIMASFDSALAPLLNMIYKKCKGQKEIIFIGHPKNLSPLSLQLLDRFLMKHKGEFIYKTTRDLF